MTALGAHTDLRPVLRPDDVRRLLNTRTKRTLAAYLHAHPYTFDYIPGLATRLSQPARQIESAVIELTEAGILVQLGFGAHAMFALNVRGGWKEALGDYFARYPQVTKLLTRVLSHLL